MTYRTAALALATSAGLLLALAGCGAADTPAATSSSTAPTTSTSTGADGTGLAVSEAWVKAVPTVGQGAMTGAFGKITNTTDKDIVVAKATQDASEMTELHETVMVDGKKVMREVQGGFTIKAKSTLELKPGDNHIMLMQMKRALPVGSEVKFTLTTRDGKQLTWKAMAKEFTAPQENYMSHTGSMTGTMSPSMGATTK